jgi:CRP-like cAMP-binding protein
VTGDRTDIAPPPTDGARPERNRLLAALPRADYARLVPRLEDVRLAHGQALAVCGAPIEHVYFPRGAVAAVVVATGGDQVVGAAAVGSEGLVGLAAALDGGVSTDDVICQIPGAAARMGAGAFRATLARNPRLRELQRRSTLALLGQTTRTAGCNLAHTVEERCARWLLMLHDRADGEDIPLTHDVLAALLGVRRPTVTEVAGRLQRAGLIRYRRGCMRILDRDGLRGIACDDYRRTREIYARFLSHTDGAGPVQEPA